MTPSTFTPPMGERLVALLEQFHLPTMATELLPRFAQAGQQEALPLLLEVCELEAAERQARRIARLRAAAKLPPGKTWLERLGMVYEARGDRKRAADYYRQAVGFILEHPEGFDGEIPTSLVEQANALDPLPP